MKQIIDINKDKITETQQLKIEISKLKVNIHMLNKELEENKKKLEEKTTNSNNEPRNSVDGIYDDLNELKEKNKSLEEENASLRQKLENEKSKNNDGSSDETEEKKGSKYNLFVSYMTQLLKEMKPTGDKEKYLYNKLKSIIDKEEKEKEKGENTQGKK